MPRNVKHLALAAALSLCFTGGVLTATPAQADPFVDGVKNGAKIFGSSVKDGVEEITNSLNPEHVKAGTKSGVRVIVNGARLGAQSVVEGFKQAF